MPLLIRNREGAASQTAEPGWQTDRYTPSRPRLNGSERGWKDSPEQKDSRRLCGSAECSKAWRSPLRSRQRPIFEEQWACSGRCVLAIVRSAVGRESGDRRENGFGPMHQHRVPLGLLMLAQRWITHPQLRKALQAQRENGSEKIGHWLIREAGVERAQITRALALQWGCPVLTTDGFAPQAMALAVPKLFREKLGLVPIRVAGTRILYLGFEDKPDASAALALETMTGLKVESGLVDAPDLEVARKRLLICGHVETKVESLEHSDAISARITAILEQKQPVASRLVRIHEHYWLRLWLEKGAFGGAGTVPINGEDVRDYIFTVDRPL